jgi:hypothetical protein
MLTSSQNCVVAFSSQHCIVALNSPFFHGGKRSQLACFSDLSKGGCQSQYDLRPPTKQDNGLTKIKRPNMKQLVFETI